MSQRQIVEPSLRLVELPTQFSSVRQTLTLPHKINRQRLGLPQRVAFRAAAIEAMCARLPERFRDEAEDLLKRHWFEIHHIIPRAFGGTNDPSNLALMQRVDHDRAHDLIDEQTKGMEPGESRTINLPFDPIGGGNVWLFNVAAAPMPREGWRPLLQEPFTPLRLVA